MSALPLPGHAGAPEQLHPQDLVITLLGIYVRPFGDRVWSGGLVALLGELGFSTGAARVALMRLVRRGLIARIREGRLVHYRMTPRADRLLAEGEQRIFSLGAARDDGGTWTILWHHIPEDRRLERGRLAHRLRLLGFGSVQDSVWVSPHDQALEVAQLIEELAVHDFATVFVASVGSGATPSSGGPSAPGRLAGRGAAPGRTGGRGAAAGGAAAGRAPAGGAPAGGVSAGASAARRVAGEAAAAGGSPASDVAGQGFVAEGLAAGGLAALVSRAWDLSGLAERYEAFDAEFSPYLRRAARARLRDSEAFLVRTRMVHLFRGFPTLDPELPEELAPLSGPRMLAVKTFHTLSEGLAEASQRHFDSATAVPSGGAAIGSARASAAKAPA